MTSCQGKVAFGKYRKRANVTPRCRPAPRSRAGRRSPRSTSPDSSHRPVRSRRSGCCRPLPRRCRDSFVGAGPSLRRDDAGAHELRVNERQAEILRQSPRDGLRRGVEVIFDPARIVVIVVIAELDEIRRVFGPPHLAERCGRLRRHLCRQRVDHAQLRGEELGSTLSVAARGIVKDDDAAVLPRLPLPEALECRAR